MTSRLGCQIENIFFKNPIVIGSGPLTNDVSRIKKAEDCGASAVSLKHAMLHNPLHGKPRWYSGGTNALVNPGDPRLSLEEGLELTRRVKETCDLVVLANMSGKPDSLSSWGEAAKQFESAGADAIEINFVCPNLGLGRDDSIKLGSMISKSPDLVFAITEEVRKAVTIPVVPKLGLGSGSGEPRELIEACTQAGATLLTITASDRAAPDIDIYNGGRPFVWGTRGKTGIGTYSGKWKRLISCRYLAELAPHTNVPIIAGGGVFTASDVVKMIMYGASLVLICYAIMTRGFGLIGKVILGLEEYLDKMGYETLQDVRGMALNYITDNRNIEYEEISAWVDPAKCNGCGICLNIGSCDAFYRVDNIVEVDKAQCIGCGLCKGLCPKNAIMYKAM